MKLFRETVTHWPKLAWCARIVGQKVNVLHGCRVEYSDDWIFEGAWVGEFNKAEFDRSAPVIIGTGLRLRGNAVSFVCSTSPLDRLFYVDLRDEKFVSNSLACLLSVSKLRLDPKFQYSKKLESYIGDHQIYPRPLATESGAQIYVQIYETLIYSEKQFSEQTRYESNVDFASFEEYHHFLETTVSEIRDNLLDSNRRFEVAPVVTISNGYDSSASAVIAEPLGIRSALNISRGGTLWHTHDSGQDLAKVLGIPIQSTLSKDSLYKDHLLIWAGLGRSSDLNMTLFDFPNDLTMLIVGVHGDTIWELGLRNGFLDSHHFLDRDPTGCGMTEWRLHKGIFLASPPCFGASKIHFLKRINDSAVMDPWRMGGDYDRPIPRRIVEQRGVKRDSFGKKKAATISRHIYYPSDPDCLQDLKMFFKEQGKQLPLRLGILQRPFDSARVQIARLFSLFGLPDYNDLFFVWANSFLAKNKYSI